MCFTSRTNIAAELTSLVYYKDKRACKKKETFLPGQVLIFNGAAMKVSLDRTRRLKKDEKTIKVRKV